MKHILVIEDEEQLRALLCEELEDMGYRVSQAENGARGLDAVTAEMPDLILCDNAMPVMTGPEFLRAFRTRFDGKGARVVMVSALSGSEDLSEAERAGALAYLRKPVDFDALSALLEEHL